MPPGIWIQRSRHTCIVYRLSCPANTIMSTVWPHSSTTSESLLRSYRLGLFHTTDVVDLPRITTL